MRLAPSLFLGLLLAPVVTASDPLLLDLVGENPSGFPGFGHSVDGGFDVDGDLIPDLIVGAPYENAFGGQAKVLSGANGGLLLLLQSPTGGHFGNAVGMLGDVNGDGVNDVVVGAEQFTVFNQLPGYAELRSGFDGSLLQHWDGVGGRDQFGDAVAGAGDVNGDGVPDVIVGAPLHDGHGTDSGMARVFSGLDGTLLHSLLGSSGGDQFGTSVDGVGDVDGDGFDDFVVGAPNGGPGSFRGQVRVFSGFDGKLLFNFNGQADNDRAGWSVAGAGDVDADGTPDIIYGATNAFGTGAALVRSGTDGSVIHLFTGKTPNGNMGRAVDSAGDVDGDGFADLIVSDHTAPPGGQAFIYSGRDGSLVRQIPSSAAGDSLGQAVAGAGDLDGDGFDDVIVGADQFSNSGPGHALVYSGRPALTGDRQELSLAAGGTLGMTLCVPASHAGGIYWVFGSVSGFEPGITFASGLVLPLNPDVYFDLTLQAPVLLPSFVGSLDGNGGASASLTLPAGLDPILIGLPVRHAFLARKAGQPDFASNPLLLELTP